MSLTQKRELEQLLVIMMFLVASIIVILIMSCNKKLNKVYDNPMYRIQAEGLESITVPVTACKKGDVSGIVLVCDEAYGITELLLNGDGELTICYANGSTGKFEKALVNGL